MRRVIFRRLRFGRWLLPTFVMLADLVAGGFASAQDNHKQVLVLYSNRRDSEFSVIGEAELPRTLDTGLARNLDYYSEFIDVARFPENAYKTAFSDFLRQKYQGTRMDIVIAMGDAAIEFVELNRDSLFQHTPMVFLANDRRHQTGANSTGFILERNFGATVSLIEKLQPEVQNIFVVVGAGPADKDYENTVRDQVRAFEPRFSFTYLAGLSTPDLEKRLANLPARSAVYHVLVTEDGAGNKFHPLEYVDRVAAAATAPTYSWVDSTIDHGVVGGSLYRQRDALNRVGQLALRVLRGERADSIATTALDLSVPQVDWRQLRRWGINEARVPAGTLITFREPGVWDQYKFYILGALALVILQSGLIAGLLIQRGRRQLAENELRGSQAELRSSYERIRDLGGRLLLAQETERARIARELHDDITQQMSLLVIDLALLRGDGQVKTLAEEAMTRVERIVKSVHDLSHRLHPAKLRLIGLVAGLRDLQQELTQVDVPISFTYDQVPKTLPPDVTLCVFRVVQEALQNALKYSHAHAVKVQLSGSAKELTLTISDDGIGFDVDAAMGKGLGLISMSERVEAISGTLKIRSQPGGGTALEARVPLPIVKDAETIAV